MKKISILCLFLTILSCSIQAKVKTPGLFTLSSPAFMNNGTIPSKYTCDGKNVSPALKWFNAPAGTQSFALIVDDPDAPEKTWVHWILINIPAKMNRLSEGVEKGKFISGITDFYYIKNGISQYGGPCPPNGMHHYQFTLFALDVMLNLSVDAEKEDLLNAMKGHVLGTAQLIGLYERHKK